MSAPATAAHAPVDARDVIVRRLGRSAYEPTWRAMQAFNAARTPATIDELWMTEHWPVYTLGLAGRMEHVHGGSAIPVVKVDRGGQVTYHGPGQLVLYVMVDLRRRALGVRVLVRALEAAVVDWLATYGISAHGSERAPGVYVTCDGRDAKIAALGLRVRNGCSYHGLAVNIAMDTTPFDHIDPCGYPGLAVTQLADLAPPPTVEGAGEALAPVLIRHLGAVSR